MRINRTALAVTATVALAGIGTGTTLAATGASNTKAASKVTMAARGTSSTALLTALAGKLGISLDTLKAAIVATAKDQVAARLAAGTITQAQADALNARIDAGGTTPGGLGLFGLGGPGFGHGGAGGPHGVALSVAATYLGLTTDALDTSLDAGKTLAAIATAQGKTAAGLEAALVADAKTKLDAQTGLTDAQKTTRLTAITAQIKDVVENGRTVGLGFGGRGPRPGE
jgi:hypothetical protein